MPEERRPQAPEAAFSRRLSVDDVGSHEGVIEADSAECGRLAALYGIESLSGFRFSYSVRPLPSHRFRLTGDLSADVTQACVITLEPVTEHIREAVTAEFWPEHQLEETSGEEESVESEVPEPIVGGRIDVGALAAEILASAINPYPRKADAEFAWDESGDAEGAPPSGPFAKLAKLREKR